MLLLFSGRLRLGRILATVSVSAPSHEAIPVSAPTRATIEVS